MISRSYFAADVTVTQRISDILNGVLHGLAAGLDKENPDLSRVPGTIEYLLLCMPGLNSFHLRSTTKTEIEFWMVFSDGSALYYQLVLPLLQVNITKVRAPVWHPDYKANETENQAA